MNKKFKSICICSLMTLSMSFVGCGKTVTSLNDGNIDIQDNRDSYEEQKDYNYDDYNNQTATDQQLIDSIRNATYGMVNHNNGTTYDLSFTEIFDHHYGSGTYEWRLLEVIDDDNFTIMAIAHEDRYVIFKTDESQVITATELADGYVVYKNTQAEDKFYNDYVLTAWEPIKQELAKEKEQETKQEQNKNNNDSNKKNNVIEGTCIYCDGPLEDDDKKSVCKDCLNDPMAMNGGKHWVELDYNCAQCGKQMVNVYLDGTHKDDFCSVSCEDAWYKEYARTNQTAYCEYCGGETRVAMVEQWGGCCSEYCAVQREGDAYEEMENNGEIGGQTLCGWCEKPIYGDDVFCSQECENAHHSHYGDPNN